MKHEGMSGGEAPGAYPNIGKGALECGTSSAQLQDLQRPAPEGSIERMHEEEEEDLFLDIERSVNGAHNVRSRGSNTKAEGEHCSNLQELHQALSAGLVRLEDMHRDHLAKQEKLLRQWCMSSTSRQSIEDAVPGLEAKNGLLRRTNRTKSIPENEMPDSTDWAAPGMVIQHVNSTSSCSSTKLEGCRRDPSAQWCTVVPAPHSAEQSHGTHGTLIASSRTSSRLSANDALPDEVASTGMPSTTPNGGKAQPHNTDAQQPVRDTLLLIEKVCAWLDNEEEAEAEATPGDAQPSSWRDPITWVVNHSMFRSVVSFMILLNSLTIGLSMHFLILEQVKLPGRKVNLTGWSVIENIFCVFFMIELALRALSEAMGFVQGPNWKWNMFDLGLVAMCFADFIMEHSGKSFAPNLGYARMLRLVRLARILRIIRVVRLFHSLRVMILSIVSSAGDLLWVFLLLLLVMYSFAILFLSGVLEYLENTSNPDMSVVESFSNLPRALLALFMAIAGGVDWQDVIFPLFQIGSFYGITFFFYIFFVTFGVLNVVTSMFVDSAFQVSQRDRETVVQSQLSRDYEYVSNIKEFFLQADTDNSGSLSWEEFNSYLSDPKVQAYFTALELDVTQARALFKLMDVDGTNAVEITEFIDGCTRLRGSAKSIDVNMLLYENEQMITKWTAFMEKTEHVLLHLQKALGVQDNYKRQAFGNYKCHSRLSNTLSLLSDTCH